MHRIINGIAAAAIVVSAAACSESTSPDSATLVSPFESILAGYNNTMNSFSGGADSGMVAWGPHGGEGHGGPGGRGGHPGGGPRGPGGFGLLGPGGMMGGGLGDLFLGHGFGPGFGHGRFGDSILNNCSFDAASGRVVCAAETHDGLTVNRSLAFTTASGMAQSAFDSLTTNTINTKIAVSGTITRRDSAVSTVNHASDRTVSGLATGSTQRTVNGTSAGRETTTGADTAGTFTVTRTMGDTILNVVVPVQASSTTPVYPTAGKVIRSAQATVTRSSGTTSTSRREVVTYDGSSTAKVEITQDGVTKSCTVELPRGRLVCS